MDLTLTQWIFMVSDGLVALLAIFGNLLIIAAFVRERQLRTITNSYIFSLAITDLLVGAIGIPLTLYTMITQKPLNISLCLFFNTWIMMLCTISILHLLAVSYDRFLVIVWTIRDSPKNKRLRAMILISVAWTGGGLIGFLPIMGWNRGPPPAPRCEFMEVMDLAYLVFLFGATILLPTLLMAVFYVAIYVKVRQHQQTSVLRRCSMNPTQIIQRQESKRKKISLSLFIVIVSFLIGWYPLYSMNTITYFCPSCGIHPICFFVAIVLTHATSAINPFIYAYTMPGFADAFRRVLFTCSLSSKHLCVKGHLGSASKNPHHHHHHLNSKFPQTSAPQNSMAILHNSTNSNTTISQYQFSPAAPERMVMLDPDGKSLSYYFNRGGVTGPAAAAVGRNENRRSKTGKNAGKISNCDTCQIDKKMKRLSTTNSISGPTIYNTTNDNHHNTREDEDEDDKDSGGQFTTGSRSPISGRSSSNSFYSTNERLQKSSAGVINKHYYSVLPAPSLSSSTNNRSPDDSSSPLRLGLESEEERKLLGDCSGTTSQVGEVPKFDAITSSDEFRTPNNNSRCRGGNMIICRRMSSVGVAPGDRQSSRRKRTQRRRNSSSAAQNASSASATAASLMMVELKGSTNSSQQALLVSGGGTATPSSYSSSASSSSSSSSSSAASDGYNDMNKEWES